MSRAAYEKLTGTKAPAAPKLPKAKKPAEFECVGWGCLGPWLPLPVSEYRFHPTRKWRLDYAFPEFKLAVEIEGGIWTQGRHTRGSGFAGDMEKYNALAEAGWLLLRYPPGKVNYQQVEKCILMLTLHNFNYLYYRPNYCGRRKR
jgi:hypothetical protein